MKKLLLIFIIITYSSQIHSQDTLEQTKTIVKFDTIYVKETVKIVDTIVQKETNIITYDTINQTINHSESKNCNSCLNKKVAIDENGFVKNCLSQNKSYGSINEINLVELLKNEQFKSFGSIDKDMIDICKDCEFRYICSDCRINIVNSKNILSKPKYCNYDPYKASWIN